MKNGFKVLDSDLHTMEPDNLWEKYLDAPFKKFAPQFTRGSENASNQPVIRIGALEIGEMSKRRQTAVVGKDLQQRAFARHPHYAVAHARPRSAGGGRRRAAGDPCPRPRSGVASTSPRSRARRSG